jgi:hypothetical protein
VEVAMADYDELKRNIEQMRIGLYEKVDALKADVSKATSNVDAVLGLPDSEEEQHQYLDVLNRKSRAIADSNDFFCKLATIMLLQVMIFELDSDESNRIAHLEKLQSLMAGYWEGWNKISTAQKNDEIDSAVVGLLKIYDETTEHIRQALTAR